MSAVQLLTEHLALWSSADTEKKSGRGRASGNAASVYGVKKLRELILELAVRGKLVPQDASDEPASELLKRIEVEKSELIAEGKIKKSKPLAEIVEDEMLFGLPKGWAWVRLGEVCSYIQRGKGPVYVEDSNFVVVSQKCVRWTGLDLAQARFIDPDSLTKYESIRLLREGDLLWNSTGTGTIGRACIVPPLDAEQILVGDSHVTIVRPISFLSIYLWRWIQSPSVQSKIEGVASGTTNQIELNTSTVVCQLLPLPPLSEQHRIVAKVEELMALCDQLENQHTDAISAHEKLVSYLLDTLTQSQDAADFNENWQRIAANFEMLFTTESSIDALKQTLLQLAVMGKLVPQDASDEPASELLKQIQAEKAKLVVEGKIKKSKPLAEIGDEEKLFKLPMGWEWARIGDLGVTATGGTPSSSNPAFFDGGLEFIGPGQIKDNGEIIQSDKWLTDLARSETTVADSGDVLMVCIGGSIGKTAIADREFSFNQQINSIRTLLSDYKYIFIALISRDFQKSVWSASTGSATPIINRSKWSDLIISIPPKAEQHRIVFKVDELMTLCDTLKSRITAANRLQQKIADVMVEQAVA